MELYEVAVANFPFLMNQVMQMGNVTDVVGKCLALFEIHPNDTNKIISVLQSQYFKIDQKLDQTNQKLDRLLGAPAKKFKLHFKEASLLYNHKKNQEATIELTAASETAKDAFNNADDIEGWARACEFRIACAFMKISQELAFKSLNEKQLLAETIILFLSDLNEKIEEQKQQDVEDAKVANIGSKKAKWKKAKENYDLYDLGEGEVLNRVYWILSMFSGWTKPDQRIPITQDHLTFEVLPRFIPIGEQNAVKVEVKYEPRITVKIHRKVEYEITKIEKVRVIMRTASLVWVIDNDKHEAIFADPRLELEPYPITITRNKLDQFRRGGVGSNVSRTVSLNAGSMSRDKMSSNHPSLSHQPISEPGNTEIEAEVCPKSLKMDKVSTCSVCKKKIKGRELGALGVSFHPSCFNCSQCGKNLAGDDDRFTTDDAKEIYCFDCYNM